jgi:aminopeptidase N
MVSTTVYSSFKRCHLKKRKLSWSLFRVVIYLSNVGIFLGVILLFLFSCRTKKALQTEKSVSGKSSEITSLLDSLDLLNETEYTIASAPTVKPEVYQPTAPKAFRLLHTKLVLIPAWESARLLGRAELTLLPWFYPSDSLILDAKGFDILQVRLVSPGQQSLSYDYADSLKLRIYLGRTFNRRDTLRLSVEYIAKPNELKAGGSAAIQSDRGLYFINPSGKDPFRPQQLWTQSEPESASCWFPTLDAPNQKSTQEVWLTVPDSFVTLSNGKRISSVKNLDGSRTDYYKQTLPHAPYLFMIAAGKFSRVQDQWNGIPLEYLVEPGYEKYVPMTFGRTPEMLTFFSKQLNYPYPWDKYAQIVVREFVSGAMENTGAVVHFELLQQDSLDYPDGDYEDVIAHELAHHWFGNLVTAESWSQICLNESFASYGEYLWKEYKYGKAEAARHLSNDLEYYLSRSSSKRKPLVRHHYHEPGDVFDAHSYQKGACILHYLRSITGDDAFFEALSLYLKENAYQSAEVPQLRLAFEEITGQDYKTFFDQWFYTAGHPVVDMEEEWDEISGETLITVRQMVEGGKGEVWELPLTLAIYEGVEPSLMYLTLSSRDTIIRVRGERSPKAVVLDPARVLPGRLREKRSMEDWAFLLEHSRFDALRFQAIEELAFFLPEDSAFKILSRTAGDSTAPLLLRTSAMEALEFYSGSAGMRLTLDAIQWCGDPNSKVRQQAYQLFSSQFGQLTNEQRGEDALKNSVLLLLRQGLQDRSNLIRSICLEMLYSIEAEEALSFARQIRSTKSLDLLLMALVILDDSETPEWFTLLEQSLKSGLPQMNRFMVVNWMYNKLEMDTETNLPVSEQPAVLELLKALVSYEPMPEIRGMAAEMLFLWNQKMSVRDQGLETFLEAHLQTESNPLVIRRIRKLLQPDLENREE